MLLGTLGASFLGNLKVIVRAGTGRPLSSTLQNKKGKVIVTAGTGCPLSSALENKKEKGIVRAGSGPTSSSASQKQWDF